MAVVNFALKRYDQTIVWARRAITINPNNTNRAHAALIAAFAMTGRDAEAREALERYLALPAGGLRTIAAWKANKALLANQHNDPRSLELWDREIEGLRKAGMPEE
jgi:tetratricopeptide (TPR) repeat protein